MTPLDTYLGLRAFVDELARCGLEHACTSPGSRSTPLVLSLARDERIRAWSHVDERCAGFFALGAARATGAPVALACTSGTAAANYAPAVHEASEARLPLLVLTADRPPELRGLGAGQTIDQIKLFGSAVKWFVEVDDAPASPARLRWLRQLACRAYWTALEGRAGPVHLNFSLREPLVLAEALPDVDPIAGRPDGRPWVELSRPAIAHAHGHVAPPRTVVVAGRFQGDGARLAGECERAGVPLLADPLSGARRGASAIAHYDLLLRTPERFPVPDLVVRVGDLPTSRPLRDWLQGLAGVEQWSVAAPGSWQDPGGETALVLAAPPELRTGDPGHLATWCAADAWARRAIDDALGGRVSEPQVARVLGTVLPGEDTLLVASSMPVRDVEAMFPVRPDPPRVLANRGANGIDGTVSTAYGIAATGARTTCLLGDVALLHDAGGLLAARRTGLDVRFVVINNDGGGIFHFLPVSGQPEFTEHVATPHGIDIGRIAAAYGLHHTLASGWEDLLEPGIVEVRTDREANRELHRELAAAVARAL